MQVRGSEGHLTCTLITFRGGTIMNRFILTSLALLCSAFVFLKASRTASADNIPPVGI